MRRGLQSSRVRVEENYRKLKMKSKFEASMLPETFEVKYYKHGSSFNQKSIPGCAPMSGASQAVRRSYIQSRDEVVWQERSRLVDVTNVSHVTSRLLGKSLSPPSSFKLVGERSPACTVQNPHHHHGSLERNTRDKRMIYLGIRSATHATTCAIIDRTGSERLCPSC